MDIKIIVATHKRYPMPKDKCYVPMHVGRAGKDELGYMGDDSGDNISLKNPYYCELTGLYYAWKNMNCEYLGLVHYRRHFKGKTRAKDRLGQVMTQPEYEAILKDTDIILPKARNYYIENLYDHYVHTLEAEPLEVTGQIIKEKYPEYYPEFEKLHTRKKAHMLNMFVMKQRVAHEYLEWLFGILFELEKRVDAGKYDAFQARFFGRVSELLMDVYINTRQLRYKEVKLISMEKTNWWVKGTGFLKAKFLGKKYGKSF